MTGVVRRRGEKPSPAAPQGEDAAPGAARSVRDHRTEGRVRPSNDEVRALFERHATSIGKAGAYLGLARDSLQDLVQEVFRTVIERGVSPALPRDKERSYLIGIAVRLHANERRKRQRRQTEPDSEVVSACPASGPTPETQASAAQDVALLERAMESLPLGQRMVIVAYEIEGLSSKQIAQQLGIPIGSVDRRLWTARQAIKRYYEKHDHGGCVPVHLPRRSR